MDLGLAGRSFLVTGGSKGLGYATAQVLRSEGADVVLAARGAERLQAAATELGCTGLVADLADPEAAGRLVAAARERYGRLDGAVVSVGGPPPGGALDVTDEQWEQAFRSVFLGAVRVVRAVVPALAAGGSVLLVLSTSVKTPIPGLATSNGLRPGLGMLTKELADELGPRSIRVNAVLPGRVATDRLRQLDGDDPVARQRAEAGIPLRRYGEPAEFGRVAAFLLSPAAGYVTGVALPVDGGAVRAL